MRPVSTRTESAGSKTPVFERAFAEAYPDSEFVQQAVAQIPWGHNVRILDYVKDEAERQGQAITNFDRTLPNLQSDLANQVLKDPYSFDFLSLDAESHERDIERSAIDHIQRFMLDLGIGFSFVGRQYHLEVAEQDFFIDMLFYHLRLRCFVVVAAESELLREINRHRGVWIVKIEHGLIE